MKPSSAEGALAFVRELTALVERVASADIVVIETAPTSPLSSRGPWRPVTTEAFPDHHAALRFAEAYLTRWNAGADPR